MIRMAILTARRGIAADKNTMQRCNLTHLHGDVNMAGCAAIRHRSHIPRRGVTGIAVAAQLRMRVNVSKRRTRLRVQIAGTE